MTATRCTTTSQPAKMSASFGESVRSAWTKVTRSPLGRRTVPRATTTISCPAFLSARTVWMPTKPEPPVTATRTQVLLARLRRSPEFRGRGAGRSSRAPDQRGDDRRGSLHGGALHVVLDGAQPAQFLAATGPAGAAVHELGHGRAVAGGLVGAVAVEHEQPPVMGCGGGDHVANEVCVVRDD